MHTATSHRTAIIATYHGPTNTKGTRYRVHRADETYNDDPDHLTVPYDYSLSVVDGYAAAIDAYLAAKLDAGNDWINGGTWHVGSTTNGAVAVFVPKD